MKIKLLTLLPSLLCLCTVSTLASGPITTNWKNATDGDFSDGAKWTNGIPGSIDTAIFDLGESPPGYTVTFGSPITTISNLKVLNDTLTLDLNSNILTVSTNFDLSQGGSGNTILDIEDGTVNALDLLTTNSAGFGDQSTLTIKNNGILNVSGIAEIGKNGPGNVFVDGAGAQFNPTDLTVGLNAMGDGLLEINKGATTTINNSTLDAIIGKNSGSQGEIKVNSTGGGNTLLDVIGDLVVGDQGSGTLRLIGSAGDVSDANVTIGGNLIVGENSGSGSSGFVELFDNANLNVTGNIEVGGSSGLGQGRVEIIGGGDGALVSAQNVFVGAVGSSGPTNDIRIHYDGKLSADNVTVGDNGVIEMFTAGGNQSELNALFDVTNYGVIKGAGKILTDQETLHNFGTIAPDTVWPLDVFNTLVFEEGSIMKVNFINDDFSLINIINGNLTFGAGDGDSAGDLILFFDEDFLPTLNTPFNVLTWTGSRDGMFENIFVDELGALPSGLSFKSLYDDGGSGFLSITIVPEPSTWALMGIGCLFIFWRFRRKS